MGFGMPVGQWLRTDMREWAEDLLAPERLEADGLLCAGPIRAAWQQHLSGARNWEHRLWTVLMYQSWRDSFG